MASTIDPRDLKYIQRNHKICAKIVERCGEVLENSDPFKAGYNNSPVFVSVMVKTLDKIIDLQSRHHMTIQVAMETVITTYTAPALNTIL